MKVVIQRVSSASVSVNNQLISKIGLGFLILLGIEAGDSTTDSKTLVAKISKLRIFPDDKDKMNRSIIDVAGQILLVSQFTLCALTRHGNRPSFTNAMAPDIAERMYLDFGKSLESLGIPVCYGQFGAMMDVSLVNDGPVTIIIKTRNGEIID